VVDREEVTIDPVTRHRGVGSPASGISGLTYRVDHRARRESTLTSADPFFDLEASVMASFLPTEPMSR